MISNAVTGMAKGSASSGKNQSAKASDSSGSAFRDVLAKSGESASGVAAEKALAGEPGAKSRSVYSDPRWREAIDRAADITSKAGSAADFLASIVNRKGGDPVDNGKEATDETSKASAENAENGEAAEDMVTSGDIAVTQTGPSPKASEKAVAASASAAAPATSAGAEKANENAQDHAGLSRKGAAQADRAAAVQDMPAGAAAAGKAEEATRATAPDAAQAQAADTVRKTAETGREAPQRGEAANAKTVSNTTQPSQAGARNETSQAAISVQTDSAPADQPRAAETLPRGETRSAKAEVDPAVRNAPEQPVSVKSAGANGPAAALPAGTDTPVGRQVAAVVTRELEQLGASRMILSSTGSQAKTVTTMRLQLNPAELGVVNIRLQSVDGELRVTIQADADRTARMLNSDSDAIRSALRAAGITASDISVTTGRPDQAQAQPGNGQNRDAAGQQLGSQDNRGNTPNESGQSNRETPSREAPGAQARSADSGSDGADGDGRLVI